MSVRNCLVVVLLSSACGAPAAAAPPPTTAAAPAVAAPAEPRSPPVEVAMASPDEKPAAPAAPAGCNSRKVSFTLARATGMGAYITTLSCANHLFTITSDRATPDGREIKSAFQVQEDDWEKAWKTVEDLRWRTLDDRCTDAERARGRGEGPVYRITIDDGSNKRSFTCAGMRDLTAPLDALQTQVLALEPPEMIHAPGKGVGVPECDDYLERYQKCVNEKVPANKRQGFLDAIRFTRQGLHETLMRNPDSAPALARQCTEMISAARTAMASYKCKL
jgi:hypothetical protein